MLVFSIPEFLCVLGAARLAFVGEKAMNGAVTILERMNGHGNESNEGRTNERGSGVPPSSGHLGPPHHQPGGPSGAEQIN